MYMTQCHCKLITMTPNELIYNLKAKKKAATENHNQLKDHTDLTLRKLPSQVLLLELKAPACTYLSLFRNLAKY